MTLTVSLLTQHKKDCSASPYSTTTRNKAAAGGFVQGGQVEDETDMLLKMIRDM